MPFSPSALAETVVEKSFRRSSSLGTKAHVEYLGKYLSKIGAKTMVVEEQYVARIF